MVGRTDRQKAHSDQGDNCSHKRTVLFSGNDLYEVFRLQHKNYESVSSDTTNVNECYEC